MLPSSRKKGIFPGVLIRYKMKKDVVTDSDSDSKSDDELHVNIWELESRSFFDIGLKINQDIEAIFVDVPWDVEKKDIIDLGAKLSSEKSIAAIFNDVVSYSSRDESNYAEVKIGTGFTNELILLRLNSECFSAERISVDNGVSISRIKIEIPTLLPPAKENSSAHDDSVKNNIVNKPRYIRFRIANIERAIYTVELEKRDKNIISSDIKTKIIDFRINVRRGIPDALLTAENRLVFPHFKKIHCFLTKLNKEECHSQSASYKGYRSLLDEDIWSEYISSEVTFDKKKIRTNVSNYLGHQWTSKSETSDGKGVKDLIMMARFVSVESSYTHTIRFIFLIIIFGTMGNGIWSVLNRLLNTTQLVGDSGVEPINQEITLILCLSVLSMVIIFIDKLVKLGFFSIAKINNGVRKFISYVKKRVRDYS